MWENSVFRCKTCLKDFLGLAIENVPADFVPKWIAYARAAGTIDPGKCSAMWRWRAISTEASIFVMGPGPRRSGGYSSEP